MGLGWVGFGASHVRRRKKGPEIGRLETTLYCCTTHKIIINRNATSYLAACHNCCESAIYPPTLLFFNDTHRQRDVNFTHSRIDRLEVIMEEELDEDERRSEHMM